MGLFGSRKKKQNIVETSVKTVNYNSTPKQTNQNFVSKEYDEKNEFAQVTTRQIASEENSAINNRVEETHTTNPVSQDNSDYEIKENEENFTSEVASDVVSNVAPEVVYQEEESDDDELVYFKDKPPVDHIIGQTKIFAIINQKGGVGKSTTAVNLASALGHAGKEVLLVDLDPQGNTTSGFGVNKRDLSACVYDVLLGDEQVENVILCGVGKRVDILPATINLAGAEVELVNEMARENRLKNALGSLRGRYDYILIDCPPSLGLLTINALVASDKLLVPIQCEFYALEGVTKLLESMKRVKTMLNPSLEIVGIVLTMYDGRTNLSKQVVEEVKGFFGDTVFETIIPRTVKLSEAPSYGQPINEYAPQNQGAIAYDDLAKEVIARG
ncbi:MAG: ParA family protein [Anaerotardibacter sp.]